MEIILVRHGQTEGNKIHRFIGGRTDEPVSREGMEALKKRTYPQPEHIFSSPMLRCVQTAQAIFRGRSPEVVEGFREWIACLMDCGWTDEEIRMVSTVNPAKMLDIDITKPMPWEQEEKKED